MAVSGFALVVQRTITISAYRLVRFIIMSIQSLLWYLDGTAKKAKDTLKPENFDRCVQVLDIKAFHSFDPFVNATTLNDFIYTHNRFESTQYIYENDHVTLITITPEYAIFGEARDKGMELWRSEYGPFMNLAQLKYCNKLLIVPLYAFNRMTEELGERDPNCPIIFLFNVTRCGSTLFTQMMEYSGQCVAISEPGGPYKLAMMYLRNGDSKELRLLIRSTIRWICRPYQNFKPMAYIVKVSPSVKVLLKLFKEFYPNSSYIFLYRNMLDMAKSYYRMSRELPSIYVMMTRGKIRKSTAETLLKLGGYSGEECRFRLFDDLMFPLLVYFFTAKSYLELYRNGTLNIRAVRYEDIIRDPIYAMRAILNHCNLPESLAESAVVGMKEDSQRNSMLSQTILQRHTAPNITVKGRELMNVWAKKFGVPTLDEDDILPGTVTTKQL